MQTRSLLPLIGSLWTVAPTLTPLLVLLVSYAALSPVHPSIHPSTRPHAHSDPYKSATKQKFLSKPNLILAVPATCSSLCSCVRLPKNQQQFQQLVPAVAVVGHLLFFLCYLCG
ncbi:hypothetical protein ABZP36_010133 [Zizania latifolia]